MPEEGDQGDKVFRLKPNFSLGKSDESPEQRKRDASLFIENTRIAIAEREAEIRQCDIAIGAGIQTIKNLKSEYEGPVTDIDIKRYMQKAQKDLDGWEHRKQICEAILRDLKHTLTEAVRYHHTLDTQPDLPKTE